MSKRTCGQVLVLPSGRPVRPAADDDFFYMSKRTCGQVLVLQSRRLVRPAADDDFFICRNVHVDKCLCCKADVWCVLQLMMTLLNYFTLCKIVSFGEK